MWHRMVSTYQLSCLPLTDFFLINSSLSSSLPITHHYHHHFLLIPEYSAPAWDPPNIYIFSHHIMVPLYPLYHSTAIPTIPTVLLYVPQYRMDLQYLLESRARCGHSVLSCIRIWFVLFSIELGVWCMVVYDAR